MRGLGSPSCSAGMPNPPPKNRKLVRTWLGVREGRGKGGGEGEREGRGKGGKGGGGGRGTEEEEEDESEYVCIEKE